MTSQENTLMTALPSLPILGRANPIRVLESVQYKIRSSTEEFSPGPMNPDLSVRLHQVTRPRNHCLRRRRRQSQRSAPDMRKLLVSSFVSLDGVVESPMTWASRFFDDECRAYAHRKLDDVEFFLLGRKAYESFVPAWPTITGNAYIDRINGLKKLVVSTTLDEVKWNASLIRGDVAEELAALKSQAGGHILKYGVTALDRTLLDNKLVDEYDLFIMPTKVGQGKRAFADIDADKLNLELVRTRRFANGVVALTYRPH
jgi:dihydrofolate reductase